MCFIFCVYILAIVFFILVNLTLTKSLIKSANVTLFLIGRSAILNDEVHTVLDLSVGIPQSFL